MEVKALIKSEWNEVEGSRPAVQFASHSTRSIGHFLVEEVITRTKGETPVRREIDASGEVECLGQPSVIFKFLFVKCIISVSDGVTYIQCPREGKFCISVRIHFLSLFFILLDLLIFQVI